MRINEYKYTYNQLFFFFFFVFVVAALRWHYFGPELDHHAYAQYLEARRARKWRGVDVNPEDYIPEQYKGQ